MEGEKREGETERSSIKSKGTDRQTYRKRVKAKGMYSKD